MLALGLLVVYAGIALARVDRIDAGPTLARHVQAAWHLAEGRPPEVTIGGDGNLFADRLPLLFVPLAAVTRVLPVTATLLVAQAAALAVGVVPLWLLARKVINLRVGATLALALAYACHPAVADLALGDFHPQAMALSPLLAAAYFAGRRAWGWFGLAATAAVLWSAELGVVVATWGLVLVAEGERRVGMRAAIGGAAWSLFALFAVQAPLGRTGFIAPGAFERYGDGGFEVLVEMLRNPFRPVVDMFGRSDVESVVWVLAPLLFLPILSFRKLVPALPLTALVLIANVPVRGANGGARLVPLIAFAFIGAAYSLERLGRPSIERVVVDRRLVGLLLLAAVAAVVTAWPLTPYEQPWSIDGDRESAKREAVATLPPVVPVRVPGELAPEVAERRRVELVDPDERDPAALVQGVDALIIDELVYVDLGPPERHALRNAIEAEGMVQLRRREGIVTFVRILDDGDLVVSRLPSLDPAPAG